MFSERGKRPILRWVFDRPDIGVFTQALRSCSTHCLFVWERIVLLPEDWLTTLAWDLSLGLDSTVRGKARRYTLLILRQYHSFARLAVLKGDMRLDKRTRIEIGTRSGNEAVSTEATTLIQSMHFTTEKIPLIRYAVNVYLFFFIFFLLIFTYKHRYYVSNIFF